MFKFVNRKYQICSKETVKDILIKSTWLL